MKHIVKYISCFLSCVLVMISFCGCRTDAAGERQSDHTQTLLGDADGDGTVTIMDATVIQRHLVGLATSSFCKAAADVDASGDVEITDATYIQRYLASIRVSYPIDEPMGEHEETEEAAMEQTGWTTAVPQKYFAAASEQGTVERVEYASKDYAGNSADVTKEAYVYLPYGYDENDADTRYDIVYLMHGWGGHAGEYFQYFNVKDMLDNMIANGDIAPTIFVSATFYNENSSTDFGNSERELRAFHNDFEKHLMPAVEGKYYTYAKSTSDEDLKASRDHRAFGGFSLGSVTTWQIFVHDYDYVRYFLPMSGSSWYYGTYGDFQTEKNVDYIQSLVEDNDLDERGYFIYHAVGTQDSVKSQTIDMANEMLSRTDVFTPEHYVFYQKEGGAHDYYALREFMYNALPHFFKGQSNQPENKAYFTKDTKISEVQNDTAFGDWGRLIFPVDSSYYSGDTLGELDLTWYNYVNADKTVEIVNYLKNHALAGDTVFYDIYTDAEKAADPAKKDTGLFFFTGKANDKTAIVNAGGGFSYVGAMHDSFPHALELSKKGYNAFALIYRPGAQTACEDLARAIAFIHENAAKLQIDVEDYSLWGGSAGARMAAWLGAYGTESFGEKAYPKPAAVIVNYTGLSDVTGNEPPTYSAVGTSDGIANWRTMQNRINDIKANGTDAEIEIFDGLPHGFGLGQGTIAEGWLDNAVAFWERQYN